MFASQNNLETLGSLSQFNSSTPLYPTRCFHTISQEDRNSVLSLVASKRYLFSGSQSSQIHVRSLTYCTQRPPLTLRLGMGSANLHVSYYFKRTPRKCVGVNFIRG